MKSFIYFVQEAVSHDPSVFKAVLASGAWDGSKYKDQKKHKQEAKELPRMRARDGSKVSSAIEDYTNNSGPINTHLIENKPKPENKRTQAYYYWNQRQNAVEHMDRAMRGKFKPITADLHVYSGIGFNPRKHFQKGGGIIHMPAYTSTSINPYVAAEFGAPEQRVKLGRKWFPGRAGHVLHFKLPMGYNRGGYVGHISRHPSEQEFLLDKNQKWKLESHQEVRHNQRRQHIWTVVPHEED